MDLDNVVTPKRTGIVSGKDSWYPYYAGFSSNFVESILSSPGISTNACVVDPWNGSGTTTLAAYEKGLSAYGFDLNPVMVIAAKACILPNSEKGSLVPLGAEIVARARLLNDSSNNFSDPLATWFSPIGCINFRSLEQAIQKILVNERNYNILISTSGVEYLSSIAAFYYVALFRTLRKVLLPFSTSNPTWIKVPKHSSNKLRPSLESIANTFLSEIAAMVENFPPKIEQGGNVVIAVNSSDSSPLPNSTADYIITSPPYCTRIDYAVATMPELTLLGFDPETSFDELRRRLIGTSTVPQKVPAINEAWGGECMNLLHGILTHESKASPTYYYKNHVQYFDSMYNSLSEVSRILKTNGKCVLVVQDSYYKNVYNDLSKIMTEMGASHGLALTDRKDFATGKNMAGINKNSKKYRTSLGAVESVLCFTK